VPHDSDVAPGPTEPEHARDTERVRGRGEHRRASRARARGACAGRQPGRRTTRRCADTQTFEGARARQQGIGPGCCAAGAALALWGLFRLVHDGTKPGWASRGGSGSRREPSHHAVRPLSQAPAVRGRASVRHPVGRKTTGGPRVPEAATSTRVGVLDQTELRATSFCWCCGGWPLAGLRMKACYHDILGSPSSFCLQSVRRIASVQGRSSLYRILPDLQSCNKHTYLWGWSEVNSDVAVSAWCVWAVYYKQIRKTEQRTLWFAGWQGSTRRSTNAAKGATTFRSARSRSPNPSLPLSSSGHSHAPEASTGAPKQVQLWRNTQALPRCQCAPGTPLIYSTVDARPNRCAIRASGWTVSVSGHSRVQNTEKHGLAALLFILQEH